jgi:hypothetical protein
MKKRDQMKMNGKDITEILSEFFDYFEEIEFKNVELFFNELSLEKIEESIDKRLLIIEKIEMINRYTQKVKALISKGENINREQFIQQLRFLKAEIEKYLSFKN